MRKILWKDHPFLWSISKVRINYYSLTKIWGLEIFDSETTALSIFLKICTETRFHCLFSLNEKIIAICNLMVHIKCVAVIFLMKIEALSNGLFEIRGRQTWCLIFLGFLFLVVFTAFLPKTLWKNCIFQYKFSKFILRSTILPSFTISNLLLLNWRSFQYNPIFGEKIVFIDVFIRLLSKFLRKNYFF